MEFAGIPFDPFPAIRLCNPGDIVDVNFGIETPFKYDVQARIKLVEVRADVPD